VPARDASRPAAPWQRACKARERGSVVAGGRAKAGRIERIGGTPAGDPDATQKGARGAGGPLCGPRAGPGRAAVPGSHILRSRLLAVFGPGFGQWGRCRPRLDVEGGSVGAARGCGSRAGGAPPRQKGAAPPVTARRRARRRAMAPREGAAHAGAASERRAIGPSRGEWRWARPKARESAPQGELAAVTVPTSWFP
jgi:hypothetical protein